MKNEISVLVGGVLVNVIYLLLGQGLNEVGVGMVLGIVLLLLYNWLDSKIFKKKESNSSG